jgi:hypothetical protein
VAAGKLVQRVASDWVTLKDSGHSEFMPGAGGTLPVDDEGVPTQSTTIIQNGILVSYLHNRETAAHFGVEPTGNARAWEYADEPLIRMRNTFIEPGSQTLEEIIASNRWMPSRGTSCGTWDPAIVARVNRPRWMRAAPTFAVGPLWADSNLPRSFPGHLGRRLRQQGSAPRQI